MCRGRSRCVPSRLVQVVYLIYGQFSRLILIFQRKVFAGGPEYDWRKGNGIDIGISGHHVRTVQLASRIPIQTRLLDSRSK